MHIVACVLNCVSLFVTPWTVARQTPLSMGFLRQEYWSGLTFPSPGYLPKPGIEPPSPAWTGRFFTTSAPGKQCYYYLLLVVNYKGCNSETAKWKRRVRQGMGGAGCIPSVGPLPSQNRHVFTNSEALCSLSFRGMYEGSVRQA